MKTLYLLRHAHAGSRETALADFDRPLTEQGREEAEEIATHILNKKITFNLVLCSAALRTQETLEPLRPVIGTDEIDFSEDFYNIPEEKICTHLKLLPDTVNKVLYIGHNPGIAFMILRLAESFPDFLNDGVHPATCVGFQLPIDKWVDLKWGIGEIIDIFQPVLSPTKPIAPEGS